MPRLLLALAFLVAGAAAASAASFDCAKATGRAERTICRDPALSQADDTLAATYRAALAATLDRVGLRRDQRQWLATRDGPDGASDLRAAYAARIAALAQQNRAWRALPREFPAGKLASTCFVTPEADSDETCRVEASGTVAGDPALRYQLQGFYDATKLRMDGGAVVFAVGAGGRLTPVIAALGGSAHFTRPERFTIAAGTFLWFPGHSEGTGNFNSEHLYRRADGAWHAVDSDSWLDVLARRLPKGLEVNHGVYPDYRTMSASTPLWKSASDANCCPTGGRADIELRLDGNRLIIERLTVELGAKAAGQE